MCRIGKRIQAVPGRALTNVWLLYVVSCVRTNLMCPMWPRSGVATSSMAAFSAAESVAFSACQAALALVQVCCPCLY